MSRSIPAAVRPKSTEYLLIAGVLAAGLGAILRVILGEDAVQTDAREIIRPMIAMFGLTAVVWTLMVIYRNGAVARRIASVKYYHDYRTDPPSEWIERPARAFNNLMEAPTLFYVVALLSLTTSWADSAQTGLAWIFVAARILHAAVYIGVNYIVLRFAFYAVSCLALAVMWARFALNAPIS